MAKGEVGSGRWPATPENVAFVGVFGAEAFMFSATGTEAAWDDGGGGGGMCARGVVGVVASVEKLDSPRPTLFV